MATGIKDIARELGVSLATVSRALADSPDISAETKERVWATAEALNYLPNLMARSLRSRRSKVIGVIVEKCPTSSAPRSIRGIHDELLRSGYQMLLSSAGSSPDDERTGVAMLLERSVDGLIVADAVHHLAEAPPPELENSQVPVVFINRRPTTPGTASFVEPDDVHRRLRRNRAPDWPRPPPDRATSPGRPAWQPSWDRLEGYRRALADYGLSYDESLIAWGDWSLESAATRPPARCWTGPPPPSAIFVANDVMAAGAIDAARERGLTLARRPGARRLRRPRDVALPAARPDHCDPAHLRSWTRGRQPADRPGDEAEGSAFGHRRARPAGLPRLLWHPQHRVRAAR